MEQNKTDHEIRRKRNRALGTAFVMVMAAAGLTGCSSGTPSVINVTEQPADQNIITVSGREEVKVVPDMAKVVYAVRTEAASAEECQQKNAESLSLAIEGLKNLGIAETSIQTSSYGMNPRYDWSSNRQTIIGYEMETTVTVTDIPISDVGHILSESVASGVNVIDSVSYFSSQYDESYEEALKLAVDMAQQKAEVLAEASGRELGGVIAVQELGYEPASRYTGTLRSANMLEGAKAVEDMAVMPGEISVEAQVSVDFYLE